MSRVLLAEAAAVDEVVDVISNGGLAVVPTETVYGLAASPAARDAVERIFTAKKRDRSNAIGILVSDLDAAWLYGITNPEARQLAQRWPGPLTLILRRTEDASLWKLGGDESTIGIRVPSHAFTREVLAKTGPLAVTSANLSGEPTHPHISEIQRDLGDAVDLYIDAGPIASLPSEVISLIGEPTVLRERNPGG
jgi:tRNA threonylcarbamoyl adenosine modification protein (Sua5/YciO/YrdC/YwlC family)